MTQRVVFMRGVSASGKSTTALKLCTEQSNYVRVNMDSIRAMLGQPFNSDSEKLALRIQDEAVLKALRNGRNVVVDNLHIKDTWPFRLMTLIWESGIPVEYSIIDLSAVSLDECIARNRARIAKGTNNGVDEKIIRRQHSQLQNAIRNGIWTIEDLQSRLPAIEPYDFSKLIAHRAIIVDVDGTLANSDHRDVYDGSLAHLDSVYEHIADLVRLCKRDGFSIIVCSGRGDQHRQVTHDWLQANGIPFDVLLMRKQGDERRDSVIKLELFNNFIRDRYAVNFALDDRNRVVNIWRALGIPCLQVAEGDF